MKNRLIFLSFSFLLTFFNAFSQLDSSIVLFETYQDGFGWELVIDNQELIYFISRELKEDGQGVSIFRKVNKAGEILLEFPLETELDNRPSDIILTKDGQLLCMYEIRLDNGSTVGPPAQIGLKKYSLEGQVIWEQKINITSSIGTSFTSGQLLELPDNSIVLASFLTFPDSTSLKENNNSPYITHLAKDGSFISNFPIGGNNTFGIREMRLVENENVLIGLGFSNPGLDVAKINIKDTTVIWKRQLFVEGDSPNIVYGAILLEDENSYGLLTRFLSSDKELDGVYYYRLDLDGNTLSKKKCSELGESISFPRILQDDCGNLIISYSVLNSSRTSNIRKLRIDIDGNILEEGIFSPNVFDAAFFDYAPLRNGAIAAVGRAREKRVDLHEDIFLGIFSSLSCILSSANSLLPTEEKFEVFPNPTRNNISFHLENELNGKINIKIIDVLGKQYQSWKSEKYQKSITISLELPDLYSGVYYLIVENKGKLFYSKVLIQ